ncbi:MAG: hypothetical protein M3066_00340 [Actinomycetota bacterium]|nr:hypothetical protein [Actinomycetota bacterium]
MAVYEPGVSVNGSISSDWLPRYRHFLDAGDTRGAFATMVRGAGFPPAALSSMPFWCARLVLRLVIRGDGWRRKESLLGIHAVEHELLASVPDAPGRYAGIAAQVLVVVGGRSPRFLGTDLLGDLTATIPGSTGCTLDRLSHAAPSDEAPEAVADVLLKWLSTDLPAAGGRLLRS